ncbi:Cro/CI family transcriptional regulator [Luteibacter sp.]|jgi:predicted transcriptional regulator|uniref:Cro/CI family transcriptional regulator n=1 Tax=Luteibacter sp. TaxID=1886636 RepID=UPI002F418DC7
MTDEASLMTKDEALAAYGGSVSALADALGISTSAIYQWEDGKPIPADKALRIRFVLKPELFVGHASKPASKAA